MREFLKVLFGGVEHQQHQADEISIAAAALMVEAARLDGCVDESERQHIRDIIESRFKLDQDTAAALLARVEAQSAEVVDIQGFTSAIKADFDDEERLRLIEELWQVVYADGVLHDFEASLMRRVAGLLYVSDQQSGQARKRAMAAMGVDR